MTTVPPSMMPVPSPLAHTPLRPQASVLRHRAATLRSFADTIDRLRVTRLTDQEHAATDTTNESEAARRARLRRRLLDRNLHQLHRAADELRDVAHRLWQYADVVEFASSKAPHPRAPATDHGE